MATVTSSSGAQYHLYGLPDASSPEPEDTIKFTTLDNDLGDGYRSLALFGSDTGVREWKLKFPTLAHSDVLANTVTDINGASVSREQYLRSLYIENKVTGTPFVYPDPNTGQYYLVDFVENELSMQRMRVKIFSTGLTLRQRRIPGETVFNVGLMPTAGFGYDHFNQSSHDTAEWDNLSVGGNSLTATGDVVFSANPQNGLNTVRLSGSASTGVLNSAAFSAPIYELFIVMKMREVTFSNNAGIFTGSSGTSILVGTSGGTKFQNLLNSTDEYYLNGVLYANSNMQAPMDEWGIVHIRNKSGGWDPGATVQVGKNQATAGTFAKVDIGEIISFAQPMTLGESRELLESLTVKWAIT